MLSSFASGARDVRAPLAVGLLLTAACWFYFGPELPTPSEADGFVAFLYHTIATLGGSTSLAVGIFVAYMLGSLIVRISAWTVEFLDNASRFVAKRIYDRYVFPKRGRDLRAVANFVNGLSPAQQPMRYIAQRVRDWELYQHTAVDRRAIFSDQISTLVAERLAYYNTSVYQELSLEAQENYIEAFGQRGDVSELTDDEMRQGIINVYTSRIQHEIGDLTTRLRVRNVELYDDYDRLKTEGDLRISLAIPLLLLSAALAARWSPWFILVALACPILWLHGRELQDRAEEILGEALTAEVVTTPALDRLDRVLRAHSQT